MDKSDKGNGDGVANAKLQPDKNFCDGNIDDIELCYKGVHEIYAVDENGEATHSIELYGDESYAAYYDCARCGEYWEIDQFRDQDATFKLVKEHFNES